MFVNSSIVITGKICDIPLIYSFILKITRAVLIGIINIYDPLEN